MSGGIAQLVAVGAQDVHLVSNPEISFFRSSYKRYTNFSQTVEKQVIQGNVINGGMSSVRLDRRGDLVNYMYLMPHDGTQSLDRTNWEQYINKIELLIGGQVIDTQDSFFNQKIAPELFAATFSKSVAGGLYNGTTATNFYPLRFFFCENWASALPLVSLQYHDVELRISWGPTAASVKWDCYANYIYLDTDERAVFSKNKQDMLMFQVQKAIASGSRVHEIVFNHPVKMLAAYMTADDAGIMARTNQIKLQINGTDVTDFKYVNPCYSRAMSYYHVSYSDSSNDKRLFVYPFCLETSRQQPNGSLNFSRLDSARFVNTIANSDVDIYGVNYNILHIENGMAGLVYAN